LALIARAGVNRGSSAIAIELGSESAFEVYPVIADIRDALIGGTYELLLDWFLLRECFQGSVDREVLKKQGQRLRREQNLPLVLN